MARIGKDCQGLKRLARIGKDWQGLSRILKDCQGFSRIVKDSLALDLAVSGFVTFRDEMPRAATNKVQGTKTAKPKASTDKGAGKKAAKQKTATGGARVALDLPHVAADKPHEEGRAATVLDRAVLLPRHLVPLPDTKIGASVVFHVMVYGHVRDASVEGKVSIAVAGGWKFEVDAAVVQPYWLQPNTLTPELEASLRAAIADVGPISAEASAGDAGSVGRSGAASSSRAARRAPVAVRRPGAPLTFPHRCVRCMHALRLWRADDNFLGFGAAVMPPYFANHRGLETDAGKRGWEGPVAPTVKVDGEALCVGFFAAADMVGGTGPVVVFFQEGAKVLPRDTVAEHAVRDEGQADDTFDRHFERVMRSHLDQIVAAEAPVRERNPDMPLLDLRTIVADPPGIPRAVRHMQRHASGGVCADARAAQVHSSVANGGRTCGARSLRWRAHAGA